MALAPGVPSLLSSCTSGGRDYLNQPLKGIAPGAKDELTLADGLSYDIISKWGDPLSENLKFGYNNDYLAYLPQGPKEGLLWVNHEYVNPILCSGYDPAKARLRAQIESEMEEVGGSLIKLKKDKKWQIVHGHPSNDRLTGSQKIPFEWQERVGNATEATGTLANCSGGVTPWGTILTCEENYDFFYGEKNFDDGSYQASELQWEVFFPKNRTEHYGWVVEYDPASKTAKKHIALGRFAHECATVQALDDGRVVIYSGDDKNGGCLFKYISAEPEKISPGTLYVGNFETGTWESLDMDKAALNERFGSETEMLIRAREAAIRVGGTPLDRPEDIEIDPLDGSILVALTNNIPNENYFGSILKIKEESGYDGLRFSWDTYLTGGEETGFACPDNLAFDAGGNLWFTSDISGSSLNASPYTAFGNNGLFVFIREGINAGRVIQMASAPNDAEITGPCFLPDGTLLLSIQHPGETSASPSQLTSNWPDGPGNLPKSAVVAVYGDFLEDISS